MKKEFKLKSKSSKNKKGAVDRNVSFSLEYVKAVSPKKERE